MAPAAGQAAGARRAAAGFTLIELIAVMTILGVLAAFAIARFVDLTEEAHTESARAAGTGFDAAVRLVRARWLTDPGPTVQLGGDTVTVNAAGWATGNCVDLWNTILETPPSVNNGIVFGADGYGAFGFGLGACLYVYQPDTSPFRLIIYNQFGDGDVRFLP